MTESEHYSDSPDYRGVLFQHIPKTAGTALTDAFCFSFQHFFRDAHLPGSPWRDVVQGEDTFFISGHFSFASITDAIERPKIFSFTVLRNPLEQVVSHVRWVKAYGDPAQAEKLSEIDPSIAELARSLWSVPLDDVVALKPIVEASGGRPFRNLQTHFLRQGQGLSQPRQAVAEALENLKRFDLFFVLEDLAAAFKLMQRKFGVLEPVKHSNRARLEERPNLGNKTVRDFYSKLIDQDLELFDRAKAAWREFFGAGA